MHLSTVIQTSWTPLTSRMISLKVALARLRPNNRKLLKKLQSYIKINHLIQDQTDEKIASLGYKLVKHKK